MGRDFGFGCAATPSHPQKNFRGNNAGDCWQLIPLLGFPAVSTIVSRLAYTANEVYTRNCDQAHRREGVMMHARTVETTLNEPVKKRSIVIGSHKSSASLEDSFWYGLNMLAKKRGIYKNTLLAQIDEERGDITLSSAVRLYVLRAARDGHLPDLRVCGS